MLQAGDDVSPSTLPGCARCAIEAIDEPTPDYAAVKQPVSVGFDEASLSDGDLTQESCLRTKIRPERYGAHSLYLTDTEWAAEIANQPCTA